ncbi:MAG: hypothetical protein M3Y53_00760 [Thermoproteota archaeon]|nr:hypothetical protein [Thermoproteota archaeon]
MSSDNSARPDSGEYDPEITVKYPSQFVFTSFGGNSLIPREQIMTTLF